MKQNAPTLQNAPGIGEGRAWWEPRRLATGAAILLVVTAAVLLVVSLFPALVGQLAAIDKGSEEHFIPADLGALATLLKQWAAIFVLGAAAVWVLGRTYQTVDWAFCESAAWTIVCSGLLVWYLSRLSYDAPWYPLGPLTEGSRTFEVFSRRPLFIWPARWLHEAMPQLSFLRVYWIVQAPVILALFVVVRRWSELFIERERAFWGQILTVFLLAPMFSYYTFYDVGILLFFTAGLLAIWYRHPGWLALIVGVGSLNHENTLLLIWVAAAVYLGRETWRLVGWAVGLPLAAWLVARIAISLAVPMPKTVHFRILTNLWELLHAPGPMVFTALAWLPIFLLIVAGWSAAPPALRRMASLAVPLLAVTYLFGKFREARQLDALIPVAVGFGAGWLARTRASASTNMSVNV